MSRLVADIPLTLTGPQPPSGMQMSSFWQPVMTFVQVIPVLAVIWLAMRVWMPRQKRLFWILMISGGLTSLIEPITDHLAFVWFAPQGMWVMFETFHRPMPWFILPCYVWFMGGQMAFVIWRMRLGATTRTFWWMYVGFIITNVVMEVPAIAAGIYRYYGAQPFKIAGLPIWFQAMNACVPLVATAASLYIWPRLRGLQKAALLLVVPSAHVACNAICGWPMWTALNSSDNLAVTTLTGLLSIAISLGVASFAISLLREQVRVGAADPAATEAAAPEPKPVARAS